MQISVIGCGYVGLVTAACLAEAGHNVTCTDIDASRIDKLNAGIVPIYERHQGEILASARKASRISYTTAAGEAIRAGEAIFICVGTPPKETGEADLSAIDHVARQIAEEARSSKLVIEKSTVPARTVRLAGGSGYHSVTAWRLAHEEERQSEVACANGKAESDTTQTDTAPVFRPRMPADRRGVATSLDMAHYS